MTADMEFECLFVSRDPEVFGTISRILRDLAISTNLCLSSSKAFTKLAGGTTDLVVIDWEGESSSDLLHDIWKSTVGKKPSIVAISTLGDPIPGAHIVLKKPLIPESSTRSLKAAYSRMLLDHRRHARYPLMISVEANDDSNRTVPVRITDIGDGGLGLVAKVALIVGDILSFRLLLPGSIRGINIQVRVLWTRDYGRVGCEFLRIPPVDFDILQSWITGKGQIKKPMVAV